MMDLNKHNVGKEFSETRFDRWISHFFSKISHNNLEKLLRKGIIRVNGNKAKSSLRLSEGDVISMPSILDDLATDYSGKAMIPGAKEFISKITIFNDNEILILNKPSGIAVQGGTGIETHIDGYLQSAFFDTDINPRLVHRLDKETSGVLVIALKRKVAIHLANLFKERKVKKTYWAITDGRPDNEYGEINLDISSGDNKAPVKSLTKYYKILNLSDKISWLAFQPITGRNHQIRQHASMSLFSIVGDKKYGKPTREGLLFKKLHLHSQSVDFMNVNGDILHFEASLPEHMVETWKKYKLPLNPNFKGFSN